MNERVKIPRHQIADLIELSGRPRNICEQRLAEGPPLIEISHV
jgi:hypothetical protein